MNEEEFAEDLKRFKYLKKALGKYETTGELKHRLIMNHLIVLYNVFGPEAMVRMLFFKMEQHLGQLKPFLIVMNVLPEVVMAIGKDSRDFDTDDIEMDMVVVAALREDLG